MKQCPRCLGILTAWDGRQTCIRCEWEETDGISDSLPHPDLLACTVSCSSQEITIQCDNHDVRDRLMNWLTGSKSA